MCIRDSDNAKIGRQVSARFRKDVYKRQVLSGVPTKIVSSPANVPRISSKYIESSADAAPCANPGSVLMMTNALAHLMEVTASAKTRLKRPDAASPLWLSVTYFCVPLPVITLTMPNSLMSLETVACVTSVSYTHLDVYKRQAF